MDRITLIGYAKDNLMSDLRSEAKAHLEGPRVISEPGAGLTRLIARYVAGEPWDDPELLSNLSPCLQYAQAEIARREGATSGSTGDVQLFYRRARPFFKISRPKCYPAGARP